MRVVCISDTHGYHNEVPVPEGDILIHAGDLTGRGTYTEVLKFAKWFNSLGGFKKKIFIAGNHDFLFERQPEMGKLLFNKDIIYLENNEVEISGVKFWGTPWTPWFHNWAFNATGDMMQRVADMIPLDTNVLITHGPPRGVQDLCPDGKRAGCPALERKLHELKDLSLHVFGHIHQEYGWVNYLNHFSANASICTEEYTADNSPLVFDIFKKGL